MDPAGMAPRAQTPQPCSRCFEPRLLLAVVGRLSVCADCWRQAGSPFPVVRLGGEEQLERDNATRARMSARGGTDRHMVRNGRT